MSLNPDFIKQLKEKAGIVEVVGEYVRLRKSGANFMGLCPFHAERSPSFSVVEKKGIYHCFGCQKGGDVISFLQEVQGLSFHEAVKTLSYKFNVPLPAEFSKLAASSARHVGDESKFEIFYKLNRFVAQFYHQNLFSPSGQAAREYLLNRGISEDTMKKAYVGYAPAAWSELYDFLASKKAPLDKAEQLGLIRRKGDSAAANAPALSAQERQHYDVFRDRVMFPVIDLKGRVIAFGGRSLGPTEGPKYLNSPETPVFKKGTTLYGIFQAQKEIRAEDQAIIVEGYMDCIALHQAGFGHVVASLGTALTEGQVGMLKRFTQNITLLFDGDAAGQDAQDRAMEVFLKLDLVVKAAVLPTGQDPDDFVRAKGNQALQELLSKAPYLLDRKILELASQAGAQTEGRARAVDRILPWLAQISSDTARLVRIQQISGLFGVEERLLERRVREIRPGGAGQRGSIPQFQRNFQQRRAPVPMQQALDPLDSKLVQFLAAYPMVRGLLVQSDLVLEALETESTQRWVKGILFQSTSGGLDENVLELADTNSLKSVITGALAKAEQEAAEKKQDELVQEFKDLNNRLIRRGLERRRDRLRMLILKADSAGGADELSRLMTEYGELVKNLEKPIEPFKEV